MYAYAWRDMSISRKCPEGDVDTLCIYIYIYRERERDSDREKERG